ncbi:uncharacterized protein LOC128547011 [Mercenaria mercenaria]|uniref:uncharacterized protein LOC128547011 n=1 Tax=Mercenaria mercenaria TaxID=6596 RepID=UPI00234F2FC1|nr:uncharacterized protein LOC128547011 [Mercenaria mercenaria]
MACAPKQNPKDRRIVDNMIIGGIILTCTVLPVGFYFMPVSDVRLETAWQRVIFTFRWQTLSLLTSLFGIHRLMHLRHTTAAINPMSGNDNILEIDARYLQNTFEQLFISASGQLILATYLENSVQRVIPVLVLYFVLSRAIFYYGYIKSPLKRAIGMCMTYAPNLVTYPFSLYCLIVYGPLYGLK